MPRTITSTASGKARKKRFSRRFFNKDNVQNGSPAPAANARPSAGKQASPAIR